MMAKKLLKFVTIGSVDDGKSSLLGRLFWGCQAVFDDQMELIKLASIKRQFNGIDYSLLLDGLKDEREQGITIDVAYRYFSTNKTKFIVSDCPGHEQYTRNAVTGASNADLAVILIDARNGILKQTKRHSFIASLLGVKHVIIAINKMDLVNYAQEVYDRIKEEYIEFSAKLDFIDLHFIPISALKGDNIIDKSQNMKWYQGQSFIDLLEEIHIESDKNFIDFRFPVQYIIRKDEFRGYAGSIASGSIKVGSDIMVLPSKQISKVASISTYDGELQAAYHPMAVTLTLEDEIDISRGDVITTVNNTPEISQSIEAMIVWMSKLPMSIDKEYLIKHLHQIVNCKIDRLFYNIDINTLKRRQKDELELNDFGRIKLTAAKPLIWDIYTTNKITGSFILIDKQTNNTIAAGMIIKRAIQDNCNDYELMMAIKYLKNIESRYPKININRMISELESIEN